MHKWFVRVADRYLVRFFIDQSVPSGSASWLYSGYSLSGSFSGSARLHPNVARRRPRTGLPRLTLRRWRQFYFAVLSTPPRK